MIRLVVPTEDTSRPTWGLTVWGVGLIAFEIAMTFASVILGVLALSEAHYATERNCRNIKELAKIERKFIGEQQAQSKGLLEHGITFGIPKAELPKLLAQSEASQSRFLLAFERLHEAC